jgi:predicted nucleic acid-binding protein
LKIVVDTNVLVSALLRPGSLPGRVLDLVLARRVGLALDHRIFTEYDAVLSRPEFGLPPDSSAISW